MALQKQVSPMTAVVTIVLVILVIGGIWWFVRGRGPGPADPQEVERMLQQQSPASPVAPPGAAPTPAVPSPR